MSQTQPSARTVRDVITEAHKIFFGDTHLRSQSLEQAVFMQKLFALTAERKTMSEFEVSDIDAVAFVTDEEFTKLVAEARAIGPFKGLLATSTPQQL